MGFLTQLSHSLIEKYYQKSFLDFERDLPRFQEFQQSKLRELLAHASETSWGRERGITQDWDYERFKSELPPTIYEDWDELVQKQMQSGEAVISSGAERYQPTSGSTAKRKWIPYSHLLTREFDMAIGPWMGGLYREYPGLKKGKHYWSLSWMPDELRAEMEQLDDLDVFPYWQQLLLKQTMAVPNSISYARSSQAATVATLAWLSHTTDLAMIFVWSPTFALNLLRVFPDYKEDLVEVLERGDWGEWKEWLKSVPCPKNKAVGNFLKNWNGEVTTEFLLKLWPNLTLISAWETGPSRPWANKLKNYFPQTAFQGKGLFATEAVVTIPFQGQYALSYKSHFYEFECLESGDILPSWELKKNQIVTPLVSTGSGFFRYRLMDKLQVSAFLGGCPCLEFLGRLRDVDLVGEKMSSEFADEVFQKLTEKYQILRGVSLFAVENEERPYYVALFHLVEGGEVPAGLEEDLEQHLKESFHYSLARDLNQLDRPQVICRQEAYAFYKEVAKSKGMVEGDVKPESLMKVQEHHLGKENYDNT